MRHPSTGDLYLPKEEYCTGPHSSFSPAECMLVTGWDETNQMFLIYYPLSAGEFNHWSIGADDLLTYYKLAAGAQQQAKISDK